MKVVFFGSSDFSLPTLETLIASHHQVEFVITTPSKPKGRGLKIQPNPVQLLAQEKGIAFEAPESLKAATDLIEELRSRQIDALVVASYGKILPISWLELPRRFPLNLHPSLLPKYRGAAPLNWQIINGEKMTGVTIFKMEAGLDSGDIILQKEVALDEREDAGTLSRKLATEGAFLMKQVLDALENGQIISLTPQDASAATFAPKLKREDGFLDWNRSAMELCRLVRGLVPWPGAYVLFKKDPLKILKARVDSAGDWAGKPGEILEMSKTGWVRVQTGKDTLVIETLQPAGKREMTAQEFAIGQRLTPKMFF